MDALGTSGELIRARLPGSTANLQSILALPQIDGLGAVPLEQKIPASFLQEAQHKPAGEQTPVFITLMTDDPDAVWYAELETLGVVVGDFHADIRTYEANLSFGILQRVAAADFVLAIEPVGVVRATHDTSVPTMGADAIRFYEASTGLFSGTGGASVPIGVMDTGLNTKHMDISANRNSICGVNFITDNLFQSPTQIDEQYDLWFDRHGHGSHVVGSIVGNGRSLPQYSGVAAECAAYSFRQGFVSVWAWDRLQCDRRDGFSGASFQLRFGFRRINPDQTIHCQHEPGCSKLGI